MATWTEIPQDALNPDSPARAIDAQALRDNPIAIAEGAAGAPKITDAALDVGNETETGTSWVLERISGASAGALGTYAFAWLDSQDTPPAFGATVSGGSLRPAGFTQDDGVSTFSNRTRFRETDEIYGSAGTDAPTLSGTWRCMGEAIQDSGDDGNYPHTLWLRIA